METPAFQAGCNRADIYCRVFHWTLCPLSLHIFNSKKFRARISAVCREYVKGLKYPQGEQGEKFNFFIESYSNSFEKRSNPKIYFPERALYDIDPLYFWSPPTNTTWNSQYKTQHLTDFLFTKELYPSLTRNSV